MVTHVVENEVVEYEVVEYEVVEERLVEDELIENKEVREEVVANKENEEVVRDEVVVENILEEGGAANDNVNESVNEKSVPKHDEKEQEGDDDEEEQEGDDEAEETIIFMRTWLMEHGGYKQEDTQEWEKIVLKEMQEETDTEKDENDVDTLLASVPFLQTGDPNKKEDINQEKMIKTLSQALKSPYVNRKVAMGEKIRTTETLRKMVCAYLDSIGCNVSKTMEMSEIKIVEMTWRTLNNKVDCRIFAMRHMETFTCSTSWQC
ncbi:hypothetical protein L1987_54846 [Smallanthus sonchifolius]|uniref:Uncharacterized protein n=1 Tax=Smallanthus sonchifolius TaxID=185202 RepID=A0ACB9E8X9_9ASTR|nr:hypothetical protein L1987_54846 [Smallanthus sonchifolius]